MNCGNKKREIPDKHPTNNNNDNVFGTGLLRRYPLQSSVPISRPSARDSMGHVAELDGTAHSALLPATQSSCPGWHPALASGFGASHHGAHLAGDAVARFFTGVERGSVGG